MAKHFLVGVLQGWEVEWSFSCMLAGEADCLLVALGLLHMRVKCVIPEELGGHYKPEVSPRGIGVCIVGAALIIVTFLPGAVGGHG